MYLIRICISILGIDIGEQLLSMTFFAKFSFRLLTLSNKNMPNFGKPNTMSVLSIQKSPFLHYDFGNKI